MNRRRRVAVLISGRGSNMVSLVEAADAPDYPADICLIIANRADAKGLDYAKSRGIPSFLIQHRDFSGREAFDGEIDRVLREFDIELVCLAGFMRLLTDGFVAAWAGRMINIHPSLLPSFRGLDTHKRALEQGVKLHGCTVHLVEPDVDSGPIIAQAAVEVRDDDDAESLALRVLGREHEIYPRALADLAAGRLRIDGRRVIGASSSL